MNEQNSINSSMRQQRPPNDSDHSGQYGPTDVKGERVIAHLGNKHLHHETHITYNIDALYSDRFSRRIYQPQIYLSLYKRAKPLKPNSLGQDYYKARPERLNFSTLPRKQLAAKVKELMPRFSDESSARIHVIEQWKNQGIWNDRWDQIKDSWRWRWKHEEPPPIGMPHWKIGPAQNGSRPLNQFIYQLSEELRELEYKARDWNDETARDIMANTVDAVKKKWKDQGIWSDEWGNYPGMRWRHENYSEKSDSPLSLSSEERYVFGLEASETNHSTPQLNDVSSPRIQHASPSITERASTPSPITTRRPPNIRSENGSEETTHELPTPSHCLEPEKDMRYIRRRIRKGAEAQASNQSLTRYTGGTTSELLSASLPTKRDEHTKKRRREGS